MKLTPIQLEVMKDVRESLRAIDYDRRSAYLCIEVHRAAFDRHADEITRYDRIRSSVPLQDAIREKIDHFNTLESWVRRQCPFIFRLPLSEQYRILYLARCAWVDRIIETGEIS